MAIVLDVKPSDVPSLVARHRLAANGNGKKRRYPSETVERLALMRRGGASIKTTNEYLAAMKAFCRWLVQDRRIGESPLEHLEGGNAKLDRRHDRRILDEVELRQVIEAAAGSFAVFRGMTGTDRAAIYQLACESGFRAGELAALCPRAFCRHGDAPEVRLSGVFTKNGKEAIQPLPSAVADALRRYLDGKAANEPLWTGSWHERAADMLRIELDAVGIPYVIDGADGPLFADFHCLRHSFIAMLDRSGAMLKEAMQLARHSDPKLTAAAYGKARLHDLAGAVDRLPSLGARPTETQPVAATLAATGTKGRSTVEGDSFPEGPIRYGRI